jgi:hypothetical protein
MRLVTGWVLMILHSRIEYSFIILFVKRWQAMAC